MAIEIKEFIGHKGDNAKISTKGTVEVDLNESLSNNINSSLIDPNSIMVDVEAIHVGPTRNYTWYTEQAVRGFIRTWTSPYLRPVIMHHNEKDGVIIGRVREATYINKSKLSGTGCALLTINVPSKEGKEQILDGRLSTVSVGVIAHDIRCSICGEQIQLDEDGDECCGHKKGGTYEGKTAYWMIYSMEAKEVSYVVVPSDIYAGNVNIYKPKTKTNLAENFTGGNISMSEALINEEVKDKKDGEVAEEVKTPENNDNKPEVSTEDAMKKLTDKIDELTAELNAEKEEKENAKKSLSTIQGELETVKRNLSEAQEDLKTEKELRESMETEKINLQKELKESKVETLLTLREAMGKPELGFDIASRSNDSIADAITDLKEEFKVGTHKLNLVEKVNNPSNLKDLEKNSEVNVKEKKTASNIDLEEQFQDIMNSLVRKY